MRLRFRPVCGAVLVTLLACASAQSEAVTYRAIVHHASECRRAAPAQDAPTDDAAAIQALADLRSCMGLVFRNEAVEPLLACMAAAPCDAPCPSPGSLSLASLPSHADAGAACEHAMQRCGGRKEACRSVVSALLPLTDAVAHDLSACFLEPCDHVQDCVSVLPGIVGGARVADCMMEKARRRGR